MKVKSESEVTQSCPTLSDPMNCSLPSSSIYGIFPARVLEWGAIAYSVGETPDKINSNPIYKESKSELTLSASTLRDSEQWDHITWFFYSHSVLNGFTFFNWKNSFFFFAAPGLSCGMWDLVPWPGIKPGLLTWELRVPLDHWGSPLNGFIIMFRHSSCKMDGVGKLHWGTSELEQVNITVSSQQWHWYTS